MNGRNCTDVSLTELLQLMQSKPGRKLRLRLKRESEILTVDLVLQNRI